MAKKEAAAVTIAPIPQEVHLYDDCRGSLALYVHWPWCEQKCPYCDFNAHSINSLQEKRYIDCLIKELYAQKYIVSNRLLTSIFIGGGTPSLMSKEVIERLLCHINEVFTLSPDVEISMEINPASSPDFLPYFEAGVNRFSIGIQSFDDERLKFLGRTHSMADGCATFAAAKNLAGNVNIDLMYGLPGQTIQEWEKQLETALELEAFHISAYQLTIERNTHFYAQVQRGEWLPVNDNLLTDFFLLTREKLTAAGYVNYEISNFAKPGFACRYNSHVWQYKDYLGVGAGAHGRITRGGKTVATQTYKMPESYMRHVEETGNSFYVERTLTCQRAAQEALLTGLRLAEGINVADWPQHVQDGFYNGAIDLERLALFCEKDLMVQNETHLKLTDRGWLLLDEILNQLFLPLPEKW